MTRTGVVVGAIVLLAGAGTGATYLYFFSGLRTAPKPLTLASPSAIPASSPRSPSPVADPLAGSWTVAPNPEARYRVRETVANVGAHEAVGTTADVSGGLTAERTSTGLEATGIKFVVKLASLHSIDQLVGYNVSQRDRVVSQSLSVQQFPEATFEASNVQVPATIGSGTAVEMTVPGRLTLHGATRDVQAQLQMRMNGQQLELAGSIPINMTDFGITPPRVAFAAAEAQATIEIQIVLVKAA